MQPSPVAAASDAGGGGAAAGAPSRHPVSRPSAETSDNEPGVESASLYHDTLSKPSSDGDLFDEHGAERGLATIAGTLVVTAMLEAGRRSLDSGGRPVRIVYDGEGSAGGVGGAAALSADVVNVTAKPCGFTQ